MLHEGVAGANEDDREEEQPSLEEVRDVVEDLECYQVSGYSNIIPDIVLPPRTPRGCRVWRSCCS